MPAAPAAKQQHKTASPTLLKLSASERVMGKAVYFSSAWHPLLVVQQNQRCMYM
jgi:hypothetical protein